jgi:hypothetical protein
MVCILLCVAITQMGRLHNNNIHEYIIIIYYYLFKLQMGFYPVAVVLQ